MSCEICPWERGDSPLGCEPLQAQYFSLPEQQAKQVGWCAFQRLEQTLYDELTGLTNYSTFKARIEEIFQDGRQHSVLAGFADGNDIKKLNDSLGHNAGDDVIAGLGERLHEAIPLAEVLARNLRLRRQTSREKRKDPSRRDLLARRSGDEFVIVCPDVTEEEAAIIQRRIATAVEIAFPVQTREGVVSITAGTCFIHVEGARSAQEVLNALDEADKQLNALKHPKRTENPRT